MVISSAPALARVVWQVGALCRAVADTLDARFNPVAVRGEISGFSRASSGHCYFALKDATGQIRCAMFKRSAAALDFVPRDGDQVEVQGRLGVYEARGDLQLVVERMVRAGQGGLFEQFLRLKAQLEAQGLFAADRKRPLPTMPRAIGLVTSPGAAALHDVVTALRRRVPHVPVMLAPAAVQGASAPAELVQALESLYARAEPLGIDVILLVRGGGAIEDLWAFNDETLARTIVRSPVPLVCGVGHETDFTIADFCADLRAPTPTAAAELAALPRESLLQTLEANAVRLRSATDRRLDRAGQRMDQVAARLGRPSGRIASQHVRLERVSSRLLRSLQSRARHAGDPLEALGGRLVRAMHARMAQADASLADAQLRLELLDPAHVVSRGYAILRGTDGVPVTRAAGLHPGQAVVASLADGEVDMAVSAIRPASS